MFYFVMVAETSILKAFLEVLPKTSSLGRGKYSILTH